MPNYFKIAEDLYRKSVNKAITVTDLNDIASWPLEAITILFAAADQVRRNFFGNKVEACAIMNVKSGACGEDCAFCSQSGHNKAQVDVHKLSGADDILEHYQRAEEKGLRFGVVSSGRKLSKKELAEIADTAKKKGGGMHASLGILDDEEMALLKEAGVTCYNHNLETSREYFPEIVTTHKFEERVRTVRRVKQHGIRACCGGIFGLGETWKDRVSLCMELRALDVDVVPINFLNAIPGTRVKPPAESPLELLKVVSMFRLGLSDKIIKICGGREVNLGKLQALMFYAGANGYISGDYLTTAGDSVDADDRLIQSLGLEKC